VEPFQDISKLFDFTACGDVKKGCTVIALPRAFGKVNIQFITVVQVSENEEVSNIPTLLGVSVLNASPLLLFKFAR
jgi:hypothetical protein